MLYCLIISSIFHKIRAHRPELLDQTFLLCLFQSLIPSHNFSVILFWFFCSVFPHIFCLVCLLSIFFQIFIIILYNPICSHICCPSHAVWSHVPNDSSVQLQDLYFPVCGHLLFSVVLRSHWIGTSLFVIFFRWGYMFCMFFTFLAPLLCPGELLWFLSNSGVGLFLPFLESPVRSGCFGKGEGQRQ